MEKKRFTNEELEKLQNDLRTIWHDHVVANDFRHLTWVTGGCQQIWIFKIKTEYLSIECRYALFKNGESYFSFDGTFNNKAAEDIDVDLGDILFALNLGDIRFSGNHKGEVLMNYFSSTENPEKDLLKTLDGLSELQSVIGR